MYGNCRFYDAYEDKTFEVCTNQTGIESVTIDPNQDLYDKQREKEKRKRQSLTNTEFALPDRDT